MKMRDFNYALNNYRRGGEEMKINHNCAILRQVFDVVKDGEDDWVEDRLYEGK